MSEERGYIYRVVSASDKQLQGLVSAHVGQGSTFGGAALWDFELGLEDKRKNLRPIQPIPNDEMVNVAGDFGHAFSPRAEVRWKRRDDGMYDVLVLSEQPHDVEGGSPLYVRRWNSELRTWEDGEWTIRRPSGAALRQTGGYAPITYINYLAPNGAVQFQRLVEIKA